MQTPSSLLSVRDLSKQFGGFAAVSDVSLDVAEGKVTGLVGPNGAGKTTTFNLISGFITPSEGRVEFAGEDITGLGAEQISRRGLVRTFQLNRLFSKLTVEENIRNGCHLHEKGGLRAFLLPPSREEQRALQERVDALLQFVTLEPLRDQPAADLSYGDQKLLGIGIALAAQPKLLILDEPFAGMNQTETLQCARLIEKIVAQGTTIFLVDHNMRAIMGICDWVVVLNFGRKICEGPPQLVQTDPFVIECYLGAPQQAARKEK